MPAATLEQPTETVVADQPADMASRFVPLDQLPEYVLPEDATPAAPVEITDLLPPVPEASHKEKETHGMGKLATRIAVAEFIVGPLVDGVLYGAGKTIVGALNNPALRETAASIPDQIIINGGHEAVEGLKEVPRWRRIGGRVLKVGMGITVATAAQRVGVDLAGMASESMTHGFGEFGAVLSSKVVGATAFNLAQRKMLGRRS